MPEVEIKKPLAPFGSRVKAIRMNTGVGLNSRMSIDTTRHDVEMFLHAAGVVVKEANKVMIVPYSNLAFLMLE